MEKQFGMNELIALLRLAGAPELEPEIWGIDPKTVYEFSFLVHDWPYINEFLPREEQNWWDAFMRATGLLPGDICHVIAD